MMKKPGKIAIGSDHAGYKTKEHIKHEISKLGYEFRDFGTHSEESMDYPDAAHPVAKTVQDGDCDAGILICGSGNGMAIVANKYSGIRAALCWNPETAILSRQHNDANVLALPARFIGMDDAANLAKLFLQTEFEGGRHTRRVEKITNTL